MTRRKEPIVAVEPNPARSAGRGQWWIMALAALALTGAIALSWSSTVTPAPAGPAAAAVPSGPATPSTPSSTVAAVPEDVRNKLPGRWLRPDGGYIMTIASVAPDGTVAATYENPRPIHVARATVTHAEGKTALYLELRDRAYPGNYYDLTFDPAKDQFVGLYYHLGINQKFDVHFERLK